MALRFIVSGVREWKDQKPILDALLDVYRFDPNATLLHGNSRGAESLAAAVWKRMGGRVEPHPAQWKRDGQAAGYMRNGRMLKAHTDFIIAFWDGEYRPVAHLMFLGLRQGLQLHLYTKDEQGAVKEVVYNDPAHLLEDYPDYDWPGLVSFQRETSTNKENINQ